MGMAIMQKRNVVLVSVLVLVVIALALSYWMIVGSAQTALNQTRVQLSQEKKLLAVMEGNIKKQQDELQSTQSLQRKLPVSPLIDQYLLELEKVEALSGSQLHNIGIGEAKDLVPLQQEQGSAASSNSSTGQTGQTDSGSQAQAQSQTQTQAAAAHPAFAIKQLTFSLDVSSPKYEDMLEFLKQLEGLQRISSIDSLSFTGNPETPGVHPSAMDYTVTVSTFYMTGMDELKSGLPWTEYPKPAGKKNPLFTGP
jgi:type IV pilus assembly protein PilO